jgi:hypothetical protein
VTSCFLKCFSCDVLLCYNSYIAPDRINYSNSFVEDQLEVTSTQRRRYEGTLTSIAPRCSDRCGYTYHLSFVLKIIVLSPKLDTA